MLLLVGSDYIVMFCARFLVTNKIILHMIVFAFIERQDERRAIGNFYATLLTEQKYLVISK